jgi:hypothetical protein
MGIPNSNTNVKLYSIGATAALLLDFSPLRIAAIIGQPLGGRITLGTGPDVTDGSGVVIQMGDPPLKLQACDYGCLVYGPIWAIADGAGRTGAILQILSADPKPAAIAPIPNAQSLPPPSVIPGTVRRP